MKYKIHDEMAASREKYFDEPEKSNRCVIYPNDTNMIAEAMDIRNNHCIARAKTGNDLIVQVGASDFLLHKLAMVSQSEYLNRLVFERRSHEEQGKITVLMLKDFPGGANSFELIVKFCYGWKFEVTASNIASLHCAAHFLEMTEDLKQGNLISKTQTFLSFVVFSSWEDTYHVLKCCERLSFWPKKLDLLTRCADSLAWKASAEPKSFDFVDGKAFFVNSEVEENWWFEDVSSLRIDHFIQVIESMKKREIKAELVGSCIACWTRKWLSRVSLGLDNFTSKQLSPKLQKVIVESLINLLPPQEISVSCNFLLQLLKLGMLLRIDSDLVTILVTRVASILERCTVRDLLVKNYLEKDTNYDVKIIIKVVEHYVLFLLPKPEKRVLVVGRLVDGFLTMIARDKNLTVKDFQALAEALPMSARYCDDNLYRAIDMYLKEHPYLAEEEREGICKAVKYHKLSQEARVHVTENDRVAVKMRTRFILVEQVSMSKSMKGLSCNYQRKSEAIIRVTKSLEKERMTPRRQIRMMRKEVETVKVQLHQLNVCKMNLQRQMKRCY